MVTEDAYYPRSSLASDLADEEEDLDIELTKLEETTAEKETLIKDEVVDHHEGVAPPGTASSPQVATNIVISFVGAGMLGVPDAFRQSGWLLGSIALLSVSALNVYAMLLLPQAKRGILDKYNVHVKSYGELGGYILGPRGETLVNVCLGISQAGFATAYIIFIAANLYNIAHIPRSLTCAACIPGLALLVQFRDMKHLSGFSLLANCANFCALSTVLVQDYESFRNYDADKYGVIEAVRWDGFLYVVAITIYSMEGIGLILSLEASCKDPSAFPWLLRLMLALISLFMVFFGTAGYWAFGDATVAPITLNLVEHFWSATFVKCALCLGLYLTYPVMMFPIWAISESMSSSVKDKWVARMAFRTSVVVASSLVAYSVPDFGKFLSLVGSSICTLLAFVLPGYFHLSVFDGELPTWQVLLNDFLIFGGTLFGVLGTYNSFVAMMHGELAGHGR